MSVQLTPSKRPHGESPKETNGKGKLQKSSKNLPMRSSSGTDTFRMLCPASKAGSVIGSKDSEIIAQIQKETGAKVRVEETSAGCEEIIIVITSSDKEGETNLEQSKDCSKEATVAKEDDVKNKDSENDEEKSDEVKDSTHETSSISEKELPMEKGVLSLQKALLHLFERMVEEETAASGTDEESSKPSTFVFRLLVLSSQVGCLLGKGGSVIKQMSSDSGAQIRILPRDKLPSCSSASDELVQITGGVDEVRKAIQSISHQLLDNSSRDNELSTAKASGSSSHSYGHSHPRSEIFNAGPRLGPDFESAVPSIIPKFQEGGRMNPMPDLLNFHLLCRAEKVGGIIGKGGSIVKTIQQDTGCEIKILEGAPDSDDRIILISGPAHPDDRISPVQDAVLRVQARIMRATPDSKDKSVTARLLVSSNQIGCLLGKGGSIIAEMRKSTGAHIRVLGKDQIPKCASENGEVVQVNGELEIVQEALLQITARLRNHFFRDAFPSINYPSAFPEHGPPFASYMGRREFSPPGMYSNLGPPFPKFDAAGGPPPHGGFPMHDDYPPFMHRPGALPHISERKPWGLQGLYDGGPLGLQEFAGGQQRRFAGYGGNQPAIITSTTVEVTVPRSVVSSIYGEDGACLKQIRQISDAKVVIADPKPGASETVITISGTPEQTNAAQSLIQAFVLSETEST